MLRDAHYRPVNPILVLKVDIPIGNKDPFEGLLRFIFFLHANHESINAKAIITDEMNRRSTLFFQLNHPSTNR